MIAMPFSHTTLKLKILAIGLIAFLGLLGSAGAQNKPRSENPVYTVSNFEVWAEAKDAVAAKRAAHEDGKVIAFSQLLKRITPFEAHKRLPTLQSAQISKMITSLSVKDERNSTTEYLANMDFKFSPDQVKQVLSANRIPYWDRQGDPVVIVPIVDKSLLTPPPGQQKSIMSQKDWVTSWQTLDLSHGLVPLKIGERLAIIDDSVLVALIRDEQAAREGLLKAYKSPSVVVALLSSAQAKGRVRLTIVGRDGLGDVLYKRDHIVSKGDFVQAADLAAEVAQGMFGARLKIVKMANIVVAHKPKEVLPWQTDLQPAAPVTGWQAQGERILMHVRFSGLRHWQSIRQRLQNVQGLDGLNIEKLSARGADISCAFPGGASALTPALASQGLRLTRDGTGWVLLDG